ncbi:MAG TPA: hypothetical protein VGL89_05895 [Candidatus Koribacter sp.]|jgi:hypothetical protein
MRQKTLSEQAIAQLGRALTAEEAQLLSLAEALLTDTPAETMPSEVEATA